MFNLIWLVPILPLLGAAANGLLGQRLSRRAISWIASLSVAGSFLLSLLLFIKLLELPPGGREIANSLGTWIGSGDFIARFSLLLDPLSAVMILVVSGVGLLIHIYSIGYMAGDPGYYRFFAYLNLFMFFMLTLVLAGNFLLLFVGWEGVGLCSYLLIGFWFTRKSAADAAKKAFIVTRIGDAGFLLGIMLLFQSFGGLEYLDIFEHIAGHPLQFPVEAEPGILTAIGLLLFLGAVGKSAQLPLYVWLPDAMEGPTPVSALIHAATMVAAGVYMVVRVNPIYSRAPLALEAIAAIGIATAFYAATLALVQRDIKRILAYSTISQLGYMFAGAGAGAYSAAIFHLVTHAFFKALLFLGAGSLLVAFHHKLSDITRMGGLGRRLPVTHATMWVGALALAGVPPLSGFFSKDAILWHMLSSGDRLGWLVGWLGAGLTALYTARLMLLAFAGEERVPEELQGSIREPPGVMLLPLVLLAIPAALAGAVGLPEAFAHPLGITNYFDNFLKPVLGLPSAAGIELGYSEAGGRAEELLVTALSALIVFIGIAIAYWFYRGDRELPAYLAATFPRLYRFMLAKYRVDEAYDALFVRPLVAGSRLLLWQAFDVRLIDGAVNRIGQHAVSAGNFLRRIHSGYARGYAAWILFGALLLLLYLEL